MATPMNKPPGNAATERTRRREAGTVPGFLRGIQRAPSHAASTYDGRRARPQARIIPRTTKTNLALAGLQLVIGYQWLVSGVDKVLLGDFPTQMGHLLATQLASGKLPAIFAALLRALVVPSAPAFGYMVMLGETLAGLGLIAAGLLALLRPLAETHLSGRLWEFFAVTDRLVTMLAPIAAGGALVMGLNYYLLDGAPTLWFQPSLAYGGAIAQEMTLALASLVLVVAQVFPLRTSR
ncbi:MAG TPA: hypothetical protein VF040_16005 [Ktedonobacterales bacterium]